jgi:hypothetical protein
MLLVLVLLAVPVGAASAVEVHLADGDIITAQKVWRSKGSIFVLVNRDTLLEFAPQEVNLKKTFARKSKHGKKKR